MPAAIVAQAFQPFRQGRCTQAFSSGKLVTFIFGPSHLIFLRTPAFMARLPRMANSVSRVPYSNGTAVSVLPSRTASRKSLKIFFGRARVLVGAGVCFIFS